MQFNKIWSNIIISVRFCHIFHRSTLKQFLFAEFSRFCQQLVISLYLRVALILTGTSNRVIINFFDSANIFIEGNRTGCSMIRFVVDDVL